MTDRENPPSEIAVLMFPVAGVILGLVGGFFSIGVFHKFTESRAGLGYILWGLIMGSMVGFAAMAAWYLWRLDPKTSALRIPTPWLAVELLLVFAVLWLAFESYDSGTWAHIGVASVGIGLGVGIRRRVELALLIARIPLAAVTIGCTYQILLLISDARGGDRDAANAMMLFTPFYLLGVVVCGVLLGSAVFAKQRFSRVVPRASFGATPSPAPYDPAIGGPGTAALPSRRELRHSGIGMAIVASIAAFFLIFRPSDPADAVESIGRTAAKVRSLVACAVKQNCFTHEDAGELAENLGFPNKSSDLYTRACLEETPRKACLKAGLQALENKKFKLATNLFQKGCELGHQDECAGIGIVAIATMDLKQADPILRNTCAKGSPYGCWGLGRLREQQKLYGEASVLFMKVCSEGGGVLDACAHKDRMLDRMKQKDINTFKLDADREDATVAVHQALRVAYLFQEFYQAQNDTFVSMKIPGRLSSESADGVVPGMPPLAKHQCGLSGRGLICRDLPYELMLESATASAFRVVARERVRDGRRLAFPEAKGCLDRWSIGQEKIVRHEIDAPGKCKN